jgi:hypothetical protein
VLAVVPKATEDLQIILHTAGGQPYGFLNPFLLMCPDLRDKFRFESLKQVGDSVKWLVQRGSFSNNSEKGKAFEVLVAASLALRARYTAPGTPLKSFIERLCGHHQHEVTNGFAYVDFVMVGAPHGDGLLVQDMIECNSPDNPPETNLPFPGTWCTTDAERNLSEKQFADLVNKRKAYIATLLRREDGFVLHMSHAFNPGCDVAMLLPVCGAGGRQGKVVFLFECRYWSKQTRVPDKDDEPSRKAFLALQDLRGSLRGSQCTDIVRVVFVYCFTGNDDQRVQFNPKFLMGTRTLDSMCREFSCPVSLHAVRNKEELKRLLMHALYFVLPDVDDVAMQ